MGLFESKKFGIRGVFNDLLKCALRHSSGAFGELVAFLVEDGGEFACFRDRYRASAVLPIVAFEFNEGLGCWSIHSVHFFFGSLRSCRDKRRIVV